MGDQKYLDAWPDQYTGCHILMHPGAGIAPWNYAQYRFGKDANSNITVDDSPLIFYHFHQFQLLDNGSLPCLSRFPPVFEIFMQAADPRDLYTSFFRARDQETQEETEQQSKKPGEQAGEQNRPKKIQQEYGF